MIEDPLILLVDDSRVDIELGLHAFRKVGLEDAVHPVIGGQAALDYIFGRGNYADRSIYRLPDLILLDLKMPDTDGFEVLRQVKSRPESKRIPVIMLTSSRQASDLKRTYDLGVNSYLVKPTSFDAFVEMIGKIKDYWLFLNIGSPLQAGNEKKNEAPSP